MQRQFISRFSRTRVNTLSFSVAKNVSVGIGPQFLACIYFILSHSGLPALVAQLEALSYWRPGGLGFNPRQGWQHSFVEIDHEIFSMVILSLPLIQEGQLSVSGERTCTILVNRLRGLSLPSKRVVR